jgi:hypothetical protein
MGGSNAPWSKAAKSTAGLAPGEEFARIPLERCGEHLSRVSRCEDLGQMRGFCRFSQRIANIADCSLERAGFELSGDFLNGQ